MNNKSRLLMVFGMVFAVGLAELSFVKSDNQPVQASGVYAPAANSVVYLPLILKDGGVTPPGQGWLTYVNYLRSLGGLPPVTENTTWDDGDVKHSKYMVKNNLIEHTEDPGKPWYTPEGLAAGQNGNVAVNSDVNATDNSAIDDWMTGPFHGIGIIDPKLMQSGFGSYREASAGWSFAATLDVLRGLGTLPAGISYPIKWPGDGQVAPYTSYRGNESPDPLTSCAGYTVPTGMPIYLQLGQGDVTPSVTAFSVTQGATTLDACEYDQTNYLNSDAGQQSLGRNVLSGRSAVVILPKAPLVRGATYSVSVTSGGVPITWTFTVSNTATSPARMPTAQ